MRSERLRRRLPQVGSLRARLLLSHVLPILVIVPLVGLALVYFIENRILLPNLLRELGGQAAVIADLAVDRPELWEDSGLADAFVDRNSQEIQASVSLLDPAGQVLASSGDGQNAGTSDVPARPGIAQVLAGEPWQGIIDNPSPVVDVAEALAPIVESDNTVLGAIRVQYPLTGFRERLRDLQIIVGAVSVVAILLGAVLALSLAAAIDRPLRKATGDIQHMASARRMTPLEETGPSETRLLARAFNALGERLDAVEESRRQLLANLVHELARPLGAIRAAVQALQDPAAGQDAKLSAELLSGVEGETHRLERLVDDLTGLYQELSGGFALACQPLPLSEYLGEVLAPWREAARVRGLSWSANVPSHLPVLDADPDRLGQALGNVISNALKYTPPGGAVAVDAAVFPNEVQIAVRDSGPGISDEEQERIFAPFYRGPRERRFPQGMGLGLSIARDVVEAHGGTLTVDSQLGRGSVFTLCLPLQLPIRL